MSTPSVSIVMGLYNCEGTLDRCIQSMIAQTFTDWELIMCDDSSQDNTFKLACSYAERYPGRITVLRNIKNNGLAYSLNRCLEIARGSYIARQDADDWSAPERLEKQVKFLNTHSEFALVSNCFYHFDEDGNIWQHKVREYIRPRDLMTDCHYTHGSAMFRRGPLEHVGRYTVREETRRCQDYDLIFKLYAAGYRAYNLQEYLYYYFLDENFYKRSLDLKRRIQGIWIRWNGFRINTFPFWTYPLVLKPLVAGLLPQSMMKLYYRLRYYKEI